MGKIAAEAGVYFHTDAVQAAAKVAIDVNRIGCHALSISGHKIHAPQGIGALYVRKGIQIRPLFYGGRHERSRRAGTENVPGIVALGKAAQLAKEALDRGDDRQMAAMRDRLQQGILAQIEDAGVNGDNATRVPNTTNIHFDHIDGEAMVIALDLKGLAVSTGAACSSARLSHRTCWWPWACVPIRRGPAFVSAWASRRCAEDIDVAVDARARSCGTPAELSPVYKKPAVSS